MITQTYRGALGLTRRKGGFTLNLQGSFWLASQALLVVCQSESVSHLDIHSARIFLIAIFTGQLKFNAVFNLLACPVLARESLEASMKMVRGFVGIKLRLDSVDRKFGIPNSISHTPYCCSKIWIELHVTIILSSSVKTQHTISVLSVSIRENNLDYSRSERAEDNAHPILQSESILSLFNSIFNENSLRYRRFERRFPFNSFRFIQSFLLLKDFSINTVTRVRFIVHAKIKSTAHILSWDIRQSSNASTSTRFGNKRHDPHRTSCY